MNTISLILMILLPVLVANPSPGCRQNATQAKPPANRSSSGNKVRSRRVVTSQPKESQPSVNTGAAPAPVDSPGNAPANQSTVGLQEQGDEASKTVLPPPDVPNSRDAAATDTAQKDGPNWVRLQLHLAEERVAADNKIGALATLRSVMQAQVFDPTGFYNVGNALVRLGDLDKGVEAYRKAIGQRNGNYSRALNNMGVVLLRQGRLDEAYDALFSALKLESFHYAECSYNLGRVFAARGERDRAIREWRRALAVDPQHIKAANALAGTETEIVIGNQAEAQSVSVRTTPRNSVAARNFSADQTSRRSTKPLSVDAVSYDLLQRARNLSERGDLLEAAKDYQQLIARLGGYFPPANLELAYVLIKIKKNDEALASLRQVMDRDGARYPVTYYHVARLYEYKGELALAEATFVKAANFYEEGITGTLLSLSRLREKRGDFQGALVALEEYVRRMEQRQTKPSWTDQAVLELRQKANNE